MSYQLTDKDVEVLNQMRNDVTSLVRRFGGNQPPGSPRYYPGQNDGEPLPPLYPVVFKISSNASGGGKYYGKVVYGVSSATGSGNFAESDTGTVHSSETLLCLNTRELGTSAHILPISKICSGVIIGLSSDAKAVVIFSEDNGLFPVTVTQTGGSNGSKTSAASYTYTVKTLDGTTIGTSVALAKTRPYGLVTAGSTYGLAFYDGTTLKLWDAGEYPGSGGC